MREDEEDAGRSGKPRKRRKTQEEMEHECVATPPPKMSGQSIGHSLLYLDLSDLVEFWRGMKVELPNLARHALQVLPMTHTAVDVERNFGFYKLARYEKRQRLTDIHHIKGVQITQIDKQGDPDHRN